MNNLNREQQTWEGLLHVFRLPNENNTWFSYSTTSPVSWQQCGRHWGSSPAERTDALWCRAGNYFSICTGVKTRGYSWAQTWLSWILPHHTMPEMIEGSGPTQRVTQLQEKQVAPSDAGGKAKPSAHLQAVAPSAVPSPVHHPDQVLGECIRGPEWITPLSRITCVILMSLKCFTTSY